MVRLKQPSVRIRRLLRARSELLDRSPFKKSIRYRYKIADDWVFDRKYTSDRQQRVVIQMKWEEDVPQTPEREEVWEYHPAPKPVARRLFDE